MYSEKFQSSLAAVEAAREKNIALRRRVRLFSYMFNIDIGYGVG